MQPLHWRQIAKYASVIATAVLLILAACTNIDPGVNRAPVSSDGGAAGKKGPVVLRTNEVFDQAKYKGLLTVRYFYMDAQEASGDCILIQTPDGKTMLIDAGLPEVGKQVVDYLNKLGVNTIDVALNTHPHSDHIGGYATVIQQKDVKTFYMENLPYPDSNAYNNVMKALDAKKLKPEFLEEGSSFQLGSDLTVTILSPKKGVLPGAVKTFDYAMLNYYSLVVKITYKQSTFLFTADIYKDREFELVEAKGKDLDADFVHAPHHGNATSSSNAFIEAVTPQVAVMSSNIFQTPEIMKRYERNNAKAYSTGLHGNILVTSDGEKLNVITEKDWQP